MSSWAPASVEGRVRAAAPDTDPRDPGTDLLKRCVAGEGQMVEVRDRVLYVDGEAVEERYLQFADRRLAPGAVSPYPQSRADMERSWGAAMGAETWNRDHFGPVVVPEGHSFLLGDNRDRSLDSRYWGFAPNRLIRGRAMVVYWSGDREQPWYDLCHRVRWGRIGKWIG